ncbi:hypothetical protein MKW92_015112 [Papaver armeniacum]|nr:hypothetical protein MKW92_015112 [Papaver armeniacum]
MRRYHSAAIGHGIHSVINTANPKVGNDQYSSAQLWVSNGPPDDINTIQAGWVVCILYLLDSEKKWWLIAGSDKRHVGYWPEAILPQMTEFPVFAAWGGLVRSDPNGPMTTPMGQGELPNGDYNRQCSITQIQYIRGDNYVYVDVGDFAFTSRSNVKSDQCYGIEYNSYYNDEERATIIFGGPGGPNC